MNDSIFPSPDMKLPPDDVDSENLSDMASVTSRALLSVPSTDSSTLDSLR